MRVNIYNEEFDTVQVVAWKSEPGAVFFGLRFWLKSCQELLDHSTPENDDRSAVTFWARSTSELRQLNERVQKAIGRCPRPRWVNHPPDTGCPTRSTACSISAGG